MDPLPPIPSEDLVAALRPRFDQLCQAVADALNLAPSGHVLAPSEEPVRDLLADFRLHLFQTALQLKIDAAQAAFSPDGPRHRSTPPQ